MPVVVLYSKVVVLRVQSDSQEDIYKRVSEEHAESSAVRLSADEKGVQMGSNSRCASRSDAGDPAFDLCKLGDNIPE